MIKNHSLIRDRRTELKFLILTVAFLVLYRVFQFRGIPFGSPDDTFMASQTMSDRSLLESALNQGKSQGRFYQILFMFLTMAPYKVFRVSETWFLGAFQLIFFIFCMYLFVSKMWKDSRIGLIAVCIFLSFYDFRGGYNSLTSFPFWFCFAFSLFLLSIALLVHSTQITTTKSGIFRGLSWFLCFFSSLAYESYLVFPLILLMIDLRLIPKANFVANEKKFPFNKQVLISRKSIIHKVCVFYITYLSCYVIFRYLFPSSYSGTQVSLESVSAFTSTLVKLSVAGFGSFYKVTIIMEFKDSIQIILNSPGKFLLLAILATTIIYRGSKIRAEYGKTWIWFGCALLPNLLYAITSRYQEIAQVSPLYLGALLSSVPLCILILITMQKINNIKMNHKIIVFALVGALFAGVFMVNNSLISDYSEQRRAQGIGWKFADVLIKDKNFLDLKITNIVAPELNTLINTDPSYAYWTNYFSSRLNLDYVVHESLTQPQSQDYMIIDIMTFEKNIAFLVKVKKIQTPEKIQIAYVYRNSPEFLTIPKEFENVFKVKKSKQELYKFTNIERYSNAEIEKYLYDFLRVGNYG